MYTVFANIIIHMIQQTNPLSPTFFPVFYLTQKCHATDLLNLFTHTVSTSASFFPLDESI